MNDPINPTLAPPLAYLPLPDNRTLHALPSFKTFKAYHSPPAL